MNKWPIKILHPLMNYPGYKPKENHREIQIFGWRMNLLINVPFVRLLSVFRPWGAGNKTTLD